MNKSIEGIFEILESISGSGAFCAEGTVPFVIPGLEIKDFGELSFPIQAQQAKELIAGHAQLGPFGKGSKTIIDQKVRKVWEINADQLNFKNSEWPKLIQNIVTQVKEEFGIETKVVANLYKLLIYEKGGFFLKHKDSEKENGMFGSLIIGLPSKHKGGKLLIEFKGKEREVDFASKSDRYEIAFVAFYADCDHEIQAVTEGYRFCLVYNLVQNESKNVEKVKSPDYTDQINELAILLKTVSLNSANIVQAILLNHQYTPTNFSKAQLKSDDRSLSQIILQSAQDAGCYAKLGLITHYLNGEMEGADFDYYYGQRRNNKSVVTMGEVFDEWIDVEHWTEDSLPNIENLNLTQENIISNRNLGEETPLTIEEEGYQGNYGMTIDYWYHFGAVIFWNKHKHLELLKSTNIGTCLQWLKYHTQDLNEDTLSEKTIVKELFNSIIGFLKTEETRGNKELSFGILTEVLIKLNEHSLLEEFNSISQKIFDLIDIDDWINLFKHFGFDQFKTVFDKLLVANKLKHYDQFLRLFIELENQQLLNKGQKELLLSLIIEISGKINQQAGLKKEGEYRTKDKSHVQISILEKLLCISETINHDDKWSHLISDQLTNNLTRKFRNDVLAKVLTEEKRLNCVLHLKLSQVLVDSLEKEIESKPSPPENWKRPIPKDRKNSKIWNLLKAFMDSETEHIFDYQKPELYRREMEYEIENSDVDISMETIKKGSPHTLRLIKTSESYLKSLKKWNEDMKLLNDFLNRSNPK